MRRMLFRAAALMGLLVASAVYAQQPGPSLPQARIYSAFPSGAKVGTTVEITVNGTDLDDEGEPVLMFSHPGLKGEFVVPPEPKDPKAKTPPAQPVKGGKRKGGTGPLTAIKFKVTVATDVVPASYDMRVATKWGVSNPRLFTVGTIPEVDEKEPNNDVPEAQKVELGTTVNGVFSAPTDVDYVTFTGKAGQRVLIFCAASSIDSRAHPLVELYDLTGRRLALNRNFAGTDALLDATLPSDGEFLVRTSEFAYQFGGADYFYRLTVGVGPWVDAIFPPVVNPGKPTQVTVYGRNLPGGQPAAGMTIDGRPLETATATVTPPTDPASRSKLVFPGRVQPMIASADGFAFRMPTPVGPSNPTPVFLTDNTIVLEGDKPNDTADTAQVVAAPCDVIGRIEKRYDRDFYKFAAKKGDVFNIELFAGRIGSDMDTYMAVRNEKNADMAGELDDDTELMHPVSFFNRSGDPPLYKFTAPDDGNFLILVGSRESNVTYGPRSAYRLKIAKPAPDFRAIVMSRSRDLPTAGLIRDSGSTGYDVLVDRIDGFTGPITVTAEGLPAGVTSKQTLVGTGNKWGTLVLSGTAGAKDFTGPFTVKCTATIADKPVVREARPATITWGVPGNQNNAPTISRLDQQLIVAVRSAEKATFVLTADLATAKIKTKDAMGKDAEVPAGTGPIFVKPGDKITVPVKAVWQEKDARPNPLNLFIEPTQSNAQNMPFTVNNNQPITNIPKDKTEAPVVIDVKAQATPGTYAVVIRGDTQIQYLRDPAMKDKKTPANACGFAAPLEITVLPTALGKFTVTPPPTPIKVGMTGDLTVKVDRQFDYAGPFEVTVTFAKETKGVTAKTVTIPAGATEVKLPVTAASDAKPGGIAFSVMAVATVHGKYPINHETKTNLNIAAAK